MCLVAHGKKNFFSGDKRTIFGLMCHVVLFWVFFPSEDLDCFFVFFLQLLHT